MNQYEVMYVIDTALEEQARTDLINRFSGLVEANGGQVDRVVHDLVLGARLGGDSCDAFCVGGRSERGEG